MAMQACSDCGRINSPDARFCDQCGHALSNTQPSSYTPRHLADEILRTRASLEGERKQVTVLFIDIKGSLRMSQQVGAETWHEIMDRFFEILTDAVHAYEGTVNQYTGDGIMALFGAPIAHEDHARRACHAAIRMREGCMQLGTELQRTHGLDFAVRIGLNSGEVVVGRIGDDLRMDYTAQGQSVGLAARMEQMARGNRIYMSGFTAELVDGYFELVGRGDTSVQGIDHRVPVYELRGVGESQNRFALTRDRGLAPLMGREAELSLLDAYLDEAMNGSGRVVGIIADTGLGKSRLVFEFARRARERGVDVYEARGVSHHRADPMRPFREFFRAYFGIDSSEDAEASRRKVVAMLQTLRLNTPDLSHSLCRFLGLIDDSTPVSADSDHELGTLLRVANALIRAGALSSPGVLIFENMQWLDVAEAATMLDSLVRAAADNPVLLLYTARGEYESRWDTLSHYRSLRMRPLRTDQLRALLDARLGDDDSLEALKDAVVHRAGGNPLFVEEIVRSLTAAGVIEERSNGFRLRDEVERIELPPSVQSVIAARIDVLEPKLKQILEVAAVIGKAFPLDVLTAVSGLEPEVVEDGLAALIEQGFIYAEGQAQMNYVFEQSLTQEVAYRTLLAGRRQQLHVEVARAFEVLSPERALERETLIADHYMRALDTENAAHWALRAVDRVAQHDLADALRVLEQLDQMLERQPEAPESLALRLRVAARWIHLASRHGVAADQIETAIRRGRRLVDSGPVEPVVAAYFWMACGTASLLGGDLDSGIALYEKGVAAADEHASDEIRIVTRVGLVYGLALIGELDSGLREAELALQLCRDDFDLGSAFLGHSPRLALLCFKAWLSAQLGRLNQASVLIETTLEQARARNETEQIGIALVLRAMVFCDLGQSADAVTIAGEAVRMADRSGHRALKVMAQMALGRAKIETGQWASAATLLEDAMASSQALNTGLNETARLQTFLARAYLAGDDYRRAREHAAEAVKLATRRGMPVAEAEALLAQVRAGLSSRRPRPYLRRYESALERVDALIETSGARSLLPEALVLRARLLKLREAHDEVAPMLQAARDAAREIGAAEPPELAGIDPDADASDVSA